MLRPTRVSAVIFQHLRQTLVSSHQCTGIMVRTFVAPSSKINEAAQNLLQMYGTREPLASTRTLELNGGSGNNCSLVVEIDENSGALGSISYGGVEVFEGDCKAAVYQHE
jgi:hypothetical protein